MQTWINTHIFITTITTAGFSNQQVLLDCRELTTADLTALVAILTPLLANPIILITTQTTNEFVN